MVRQRTAPACAALTIELTIELTIDSGPCALRGDASDVDDRGVEIDQQGFEMLTPAQCADLLQDCRLGRLAVVDHALPVIVPIAFTLCDGDVIMSAGPGTVSRAAAARQIVCFQVDRADEVSLEAWSVAMVGPLSIVSGSDLDSVAPSAIRSVPWTRHAANFAMLRPHVVTGRRFRPGFVA